MLNNMMLADIPLRKFGKIRSYTLALKPNSKIDIMGDWSDIIMSYTFKVVLYINNIAAITQV